MEVGCPCPKAAATSQRRVLRDTRSDSAAVPVAPDSSAKRMGRASRRAGVFRHECRAHSGGPPGTQLVAEASKQIVQDLLAPWEHNVQWLP